MREMDFTEKNLFNECGRGSRPGCFARYRHRSRLVDRVLLVALGAKADGNCEVVHFQLARSESAACWWGFVGDLKQQGLSGLLLEAIVTEGAGGLLTALEARYPRVARQRCVFHKFMDMSPSGETGPVVSSHRRCLPNL